MPEIEDGITPRCVMVHFFSGTLKPSGQTYIVTVCSGRLYTAQPVTQTVFKQEKLTQLLTQIHTWFKLLFSLAAREANVFSEGPFLWHSNRISLSSFLYKHTRVISISEYYFDSRGENNDNLHEYFKYLLMDGWFIDLFLSLQKWSFQFSFQVTQALSPSKLPPSRPEQINWINQ